MVINKSGLRSQPRYSWYNNDFLFLYSSFFSVVGTNLGIPSDFASDNGFDDNCFVGIYGFEIC
jgi:hypothetical protein